MKYGLAEIRHGLSKARALEVFLSACNRGPDVLFITDRWITPRLDALRRFLCDPVTHEQAEALVDAALKRHWLDDVVEWLEHAPDIAWRQFVEHKRHLRVELECVHQEQRMEGHLQWLEKLRTMDRPACPQCGVKDDVVPISYGLPERPFLPTHDLFVRGGCGISFDSSPRWHCKTCGTGFGRLLDFVDYGDDPDDGGQ